MEKYDSQESGSLWLTGTGNIIDNLADIPKGSNTIGSINTTKQQFVSLSSYFDRPVAAAPISSSTIDIPTIANTNKRAKIQSIYSDSDSGSDSDNSNKSNNKKRKKHHRHSPKYNNSDSSEEERKPRKHRKLRTKYDEDIAKGDIMNNMLDAENSLDDTVTVLKPASAFASHHTGFEIFNGSDDIDRYVIPRSDGTDFTSENVVPIMDETGRIVKVTSSEVANMMNKYYDPTVRNEFKQKLGGYTERWKQLMEKKISDEGGRFTPSWIKNFQAQLTRLDKHPAYDFIKSVAGNLNVSRVELLLNKQELDLRQEAINESIKQVTEKFQNRVKIARVAYENMKIIQERADNAANISDAFFGYYMPPIDVGIRTDSINAITSLINVLDTNLATSIKQINVDNIKTEWPDQIKKANYMQSFIMATYCSMLISSETIGAVNLYKVRLRSEMNKLLDFVLNEAKANIKSQEIIGSLLNLFETEATKNEVDTFEKSNVDLGAMIQVLLRAIDNIRLLTRRIRPLLLDTLSVFAYGVTTAGAVAYSNSVDNTELLFIDNTIRNLAKILYDKKIDNGESFSITDKTIKKTVKQEAAVITRSVISPYIPNTVFNSRLNQSILLTEKLNNDIYTLVPDQYDLENNKVTLKNFDDILNPLTDFSRRWNNVELRIGRSTNVGGSTSPQVKSTDISNRLIQYPLWAANYIAERKSMIKNIQKTNQKSILASFPFDAVLDVEIFKPISNLIDNLRTGISLSQLALQCQDIYSALTKPNFKSILEYIPNFNEQYIKSAYQNYNISERLSTEYFAHVFLDIRFGLWYILARYNFVRSILQNINKWLIQPIQDQLINATEKWNELSNGTADPDKLKELIESPDVAQLSLQHLLLPENSGYINIGPQLQTGIDAATTFVQQFASRDFFEFTADEIIYNNSQESSVFKHLFAKITAMKIEQTRLTSPTAYLTKVNRDSIITKVKTYQQELKQFEVIQYTENSFGNSGRQFIKIGNNK